MSIPTEQELGDKLVELLTMRYKYQHKTEHIKVSITGIVNYSPWLSIMVQVGHEGDFQYTRATTVANPLADLR